MHALTRLGTCAAVITVVITPAAALENTKAAAEGGTTVALDNYYRRCDFSRVGVAPKVPRPGLGTGSAQIHTSGSKAVAEVHLYDEPEPGTHFDVGLIQMPRPSSSPCGPGDPGTAFSGMDIDPAGNGTATVQDTIRPGTTGVWVIIERSNPNSQNPAEFYTSEFVAPV
ncbi:hypothetical protein A5756_14650 [Mycobacterium sp. 852002-53434_SCH5985345]|uniref:hypothetical protein n=1 Tax=unclassified Mycobacterium TaxID=2642494 RepID=UPI000800AD3A|nr:MULTISPECIES: hypothetical protein [unclassified Mycobacterium]OBF54233.1 hypothetical protein A5756_14650 [Mycobacterium sp. 852002-53434_SCH5985345]OBF74346.1 hypothetical protein A5750_01150 [Mycobacterium sp. 852002-51613_SCH5001154]OBF91645.1 hypothetical protein A5773_22190 [Mycobacterium sp. 852014-52450_SCH5900713]